MTIFPIAGMRIKYFLLLSLSVLIFWCCGNRQVGEKPGQDKASTPVGEWRLLFDGRTTSGWRSVNEDTFPNEGWTIEDGNLISNPADEKESGSGSDIMTNEEFSDFILDWEWKMLTKGGNSGVKYFVKENLPGNEKYGPGLEYQILDDENHPWMLEGKMKPGDFHTMASLYEIYPPVSKTVRPLGEWNHSQIIVQGNRVQHWLNNVKVLEYERGSADFKKKVGESKFAKYENFGEASRGHILLQDHGSRMAFRNLRIKTSD